MDEKQIQVIGECLKAAASGRFFPEWEFHTLFGLEREEVAQIASEWPDIDQSDETVNVAINNAFTNMLGYPIDRPRQWSQHISVSRAELETVFDQWRSSVMVG